MFRIRNKKAIILFLFAGALLLLSAGCKRGNEEEAGKEFYYIPEYKELGADIGFLSNPVQWNDSLFFADSGWDEEAGQSISSLYRYDISSEKTETVNLPLQENTVQKLAADADGNLFLIMNRYEKKSETEYESYVELWKYSLEEEKLLWQTDLKPLLQDSENAYIPHMTVDAQSNIFFTDGNANIYILDKDGNKKKMIASGRDWIENLFADGRGKVYMQTWGENGLELKAIDPDTGAFGDALKATDVGNTAYNQNYYQGPGGILVSDNSGVLLYDTAAGTKEELFEWLDCDISSDSVNTLIALQDGRYLVVLEEYGEEKTSYALAYLTKTPASQLPKKEEIVFGALWLDQNLRKAIINFNKSSDKYHISVKLYDTSTDYNDNIAQFNNAITSGKGPDIIDISNIPYMQYASKGIFEDLYTYMEKEGIKKEDYQENVLEAYEADGKLCAIVPQFCINTTVAKASVAGNISGWTLEEMLAFAEKNQVENLFEYTDRNVVFQYCIYNNMDEFIDWKTGECYFDSEEFIKVLEFAGKFPEEAGYNDDESMIKKLNENRILLIQAYISSTQSYQMYKELMGKEAVFIGYPDAQRRGTTIQAVSGSVALNAKSKHKDGAWEFIKNLLSDEYQENLLRRHGGYGFPLKKSALEKQFEADMTPEYRTDENGKQVESMKTSWGYNDFTVDIYAAKEEEIEGLKEVIASASKSFGTVNMELANIISEETEGYFKGQKSAKETAEVIQNRIQIYVRENS